MSLTVNLIASHDSVGASVLGGLVGGFTVLLGVIAAEALARFRSRLDKMEAALSELDVVSSGILSGPGGLTTAELASRYGQVMSIVGQIGRLARWPVRRSKQIRQESQDILERLAVGTYRWAHGGPPPRLGPIIDRKLYRLVEGGSPKKGPRLVDRINRALVAEGLPTIDEYMADDPDWKSLGSEEAPEQ